MTEIEVDLGLVEYLAISAPTYAPRNEDLTAWLNDKATSGWRLISVDTGRYFFERKARKLRVPSPKSDRPYPA
jgi:transcriptional regulator GlxA family with amidase domain